MKYYKMLVDTGELEGFWVYTVEPESLQPINEIIEITEEEYNKAVVFYKAYVIESSGLSYWRYGFAPPRQVPPTGILISEYEFYNNP